MNRLVVMLTVAALFAMGSVTFAAPVTIDTFSEAFDTTDDDNDGVLEVNSGSTTDDAFADSAGGDIAGTERAGQLTYKSGTADSSASVVSGVLSFSNGDATRGTLAVNWDGDDDDQVVDNFGLNLDLTDSGNNVSVLVKAKSDDARLDITLRLWTDSDNWSELTQQAVDTGLDALDPFADIVFLFNDFAQGATATGPVTFSNVTAIELVLDAQTDGVDGRVDFLEGSDVPEPASLALLGVGGLMMIRRRRAR